MEAEAHPTLVAPPLELQAKNIARWRVFTVAHLYCGEMCRATRQSALTVFRTLAHRRTIKGYSDRDAFDEALVRFMRDAKPGQSFMVSHLAIIVRETRQAGPIR